MLIARKWLGLLLVILTFHTLSSAQLARQWVARFSGTVLGKECGASAMAIDDSGNVIVGGWVTNKVTGIDFATVKYTSDGEFLWAKSYDGIHREDRIKAIAVDTGNNIYVTGWSDGGSATGMDYATVKYSPAGTELWARRYDGPGHGEDKPVAIAVNDSLNVYVTGWSSTGGINLDFATIKYTSVGDSAWVRRYDGGKDSVDKALGMALRGTNDLYVTGISADTTNNCTTIKYNAATGFQRWVSTYKGPGNDESRAIVLRGATDVLIAGTSQNIAGNYDFLVIKYDSAGAEQWVQLEDGPAGGDDAASAIAVSNNSPSARVYVTGKGVNVGSFYDFMTVRYNLDGTHQWTELMNGTANDDDGAVAILGSGPTVIGPTSGAGVGLDYGLVEYNTNGNEQLRLSYNNSRYNRDDIPAAVALSSGGTFITGTSRRDKGAEILTIKYVDPKKLKYRTVIQESLAVAKGTNLKLAGAIPNTANVRDTAFFRSYPKIKKGFPGAPGGMVVGNARPDSATAYGWIRFDKGSAIAKDIPHTQPSRGFDLYDGKPFLGEKKNPKIAKHDNHIVGELIALRINIGASDAEVTPPTFGDLSYQGADTVNGIVLTGMTLREIAVLADNFLTYWKKYPAIDWPVLDSALTKVNRAFLGPLRTVSKQPLVLTGSLLIDSVLYLKMINPPVAEPFTFPPSWIDEVPNRYVLQQNYPNPFNPSTTIEFELQAPAPVSLIVYDLLGREVARLLDDQLLDEGPQEVFFDGRGLASGIYFYRLLVNHGEFSDMRKMVLLK